MYKANHKQLPAPVCYITQQHLSHKDIQARSRRHFPLDGVELDAEAFKVLQILQRREYSTIKGLRQVYDSRLSIIKQQLDSVAVQIISFRNFDKHNNII